MLGDCCRNVTLAGCSRPHSVQPKIGLTPSSACPRAAGCVVHVEKEIPHTRAYILVSYNRPTIYIIVVGCNILEAIVT